MVCFKTTLISFDESSSTNLTFCWVAKAPERENVLKYSYQPTNFRPSNRFRVPGRCIVATGVVVEGILLAGAPSGTASGTVHHQLRLLVYAIVLAGAGFASTADDLIQGHLFVKLVSMFRSSDSTAFSLPDVYRDSFTIFDKFSSLFHALHKGKPRELIQLNRTTWEHSFFGFRLVKNLFVDIYWRETKIYKSKRQKLAANLHACKIIIIEYGFSQPLILN